jgi:hypothetical protein
VIIREISKEECLRALANARLAHLACAKNNQPYVVPVYLAYYEPSPGESCFYGFTTFGQKVEWMRSNPQVCVEFDRVTSCTNWLSVVAIGRYEELPDNRQNNVEHVPARYATAHHYEIVPDESSHTLERLLAYRLLRTHAAWWEPASTVRAAVGNHSPDGSSVPIFYKIAIDHVTGYEARADVDMPDLYLASTIPAGRLGRLRKAWRHICRG